MEPKASDTDRPSAVRWALTLAGAVGAVLFFGALALVYTLWWVVSLGLPRRWRAAILGRDESPPAPFKDSPEVRLYQSPGPQRTAGRALPTVTTRPRVASLLPGSTRTPWASATGP